MHTDIHASSGIRIHDPNVREGEDGSCLSPRGHCDRLENPHQRKMGILKFARFLSSGNESGSLSV
jgi:hypothetical protein